MSGMRQVEGGSRNVVYENHSKMSGKRQVEGGSRM